MSVRDRLRVLVVDDMSTSRGLIIQALEAMGISDLRHAADAQGALQAMKARSVHLVLSDYNMPGMDGLGLLQAIRAEATTRGTGFILITGRADQQIVDRGKALGMNNFLRKPFTPAELRACLEAVVGRL
ncbi:response regulator [Paracoccus sp. S-4012]|uniref:response regulator n=1 Tax=Paracoccus sp. S-4012 TaxID=2665648 RepID=UPI0012AFCECC|nr:response regulator [Paracoccus sp. S-4012]MRX50697.1 response regulator [Paracoccus sp. S-4012]